MIQRLLAGAALFVALTTLISCGSDHQGPVAPGGEPLLSGGAGDCPELDDGEIFNCSWVTTESAATMKTVFEEHWDSVFDGGEGAIGECQSAESVLGTIFENTLILTFLDETPTPPPGTATQGIQGWVDVHGQSVPWVGLRDGESSNFLMDGQIENEEYLFMVLLHEGLHIAGVVDHNFLDSMTLPEMISWCTDSGHPDPVE